MNSYKKVETVAGKVVYQTIREWFGAEALTGIIAKGDFDLMWTELCAIISEAYRHGVADGLNTTYQSPYKCGECGGDNLILDANVSWDRTTKGWAVGWKETSEAYCDTCGDRVEVFQKLYGDFTNDFID